MPKFPFTNYHELNLDWILKKVNALFDASEENARTIRTYDTRLTRAEQTATNAETAATSAQQLADAAAANADNALSVAGTADAKADSALTAATSAATAVEGATTAAQEARQIADNAAATVNNVAAQVEDQLFDFSTDIGATNYRVLQLETEFPVVQTDVDNIKKELKTKADVIISSASGEVASFSDGADDMAIKSLVVNIEPVQAGSGDPSPTNVRPITGHTNANIFRTLNNIATNLSFNPGYYADNGSIASSAGSTTRYEPEYMPVESGANYIIIGKSAYSGNARVRVHEYSSDYTWLRQVISYSVLAGSYYKINYTPSNNAAFIRVSIPIFDVPLSIGKLSSINISWQTAASTVYGGTLDVTNGVLTVTHASRTFDGSEDWTRYNGGSAGSYAMSVNVEDAKFEGGKITCISNYLKAIKNDETWGNYDAFIGMNGNSAIKTGIKTITTVEAWETYLSNNPLIVVYKLITPITYQLAPQQLDTLLGTNNVWADTGDVDVQYPADTKLYIDGKIAELQALVLEN